MSNPDTDWNPDDGPPPDEAELRDAARLAEALAASPKPSDDDVGDLHELALRVRATARPDRAAASAAAARAVDEALRRARPRSAGWSSPRLRIAVAAAAVVAATLGGRALLRPRAANVALASAFDAPVEPGAGSAPSTRLYDRGLRAYRAGLLGEAP